MLSRNVPTKYSWSTQFGTLKSCHFWNIMEDFSELFGGFWKNWDVPRDFWNFSILNAPRRIEYWNIYNYTKIQGYVFSFVLCSTFIVINFVKSNYWVKQTRNPQNQKKFWHFRISKKKWVAKNGWFLEAWKDAFHRWMFQTWPHYCQWFSRISWLKFSH